jgi:hypothetical protein
MKKINEPEMLGLLTKAKNVLLVEPCESRYIPLGLAKIATFVQKNGGRVEFNVPCKDHDLVAFSTLFTYDSEVYRDALAAIRATTDAPILIGGVCASLAPKLLEGQVSMFDPGEQYIFGGSSPVLDQCVPDYSLPWGDRDGWGNKSYTFTSRGCVNRCAYCAVPRIEKVNGGVGLWTVPNWREHIVPDRPCVLLDNNITTTGDHFAEVVEVMTSLKKPIIWENGIDCKHVSPEQATLLAQIKWAGNGLRIAFDRISEDGIFQNTVKMLMEHGIYHRKIMSYVLYNFTDTPAEAEYRLMECVKLGIQPYPQRYVPLMQPNRNNIYVGKHWTKRLGIAFQHFGIMGKFRVKGTWKKFVTFSEFAQRSDIRLKFKLADEDLALLKS